MSIRGLPTSIDISGLMGLISERLSMFQFMSIDVNLLSIRDGEE